MSLTLRTRVLRHEFLQGLLHEQALQFEQAIFGGRLLERFQRAGVLDDSQADFRQLVLGKAEGQAQLQTCMTYHVRFAPEHANVTRERSDRSWVTAE